MSASALRAAVGTPSTDSPPCMSPTSSTTLNAWRLNASAAAGELQLLAAGRIDAWSLGCEDIDPVCPQLPVSACRPLEPGEHRRADHDQQRGRDDKCPRRRHPGPAGGVTCRRYHGTADSLDVARRHDGIGEAIRVSGRDPCPRWRRSTPRKHACAPEARQ